MVNTGFRGTRNGSVQAGYFDQPLEGYPGQLFSRPDLCLVDGFPVNDANGVAVGIGVVQGTDIDIATNEYGNQPAPFPVITPTGTSTAAQFVGIVVRDPNMPNSSTGTPIWPDDSMASVMREGRIYVEAPVAIDAGDDVWMYVDNATTHGNPIGSFTNADAGSGDTVQITGARWYRSAAADSVGVIEIANRTF